MKIKDEDIIRYIDRTLAPDQLAAFEQALESDQGLNERFDMVRDSDRALRRFASLADRLPVPDLMIDAHVTTLPRQAHGVAWSMAIAASVFAAVVGFTIGMNITPKSTITVVTTDGPHLEKMLANALETHPQGETVRWRDASGRSWGETTVTRTWKLANGTWCREYEMVSQTGEQHQYLETGAACRDLNGQWKARMRVFPEGDVKVPPNNSPPV